MGVEYDGADHFSDNISKLPDDGVAYVESGDSVSSLRVLRGGSWGGIPQLLRSANRYRYRPDIRDLNVGFRVAGTLLPPFS